MHPLVSTSVERYGVIFPKTAPERSEIGIGVKLLSRESARKNSGGVQFSTSKQPHHSFTWRVSARIFFPRTQTAKKYRRQRGGQRGLLRRAEAGRNGRSPEGKGEGQGKYSAVGYQGAQNPHSHLVPEMPQAAGLR